LGKLERDPNLTFPIFEEVAREVLKRLRLELLFETVRVFEVHSSGFSADAART
jgi:hypothetical protein